MRYIVLDTETTGLEPAQGHRIIEIGCVEVINRRITGRNYHQYINPDREIDEGAIEVHGISNEMLEDKPRFADIVEEFLNFIRGVELVIHNARFDVGFINHELKMLDKTAQPVSEFCTVLDTLALARKMHPGQKNSLDALCKRYNIDNSARELHGALLDAEILAETWLAMTGGQTRLSLGGKEEAGQKRVSDRRPVAADRPAIKVIRPKEREQKAHQQRLLAIDNASSGGCVWMKPLVEPEP
ncbi:DNA polymerase III epsilon subunit [hydrothermal vent metagenome]|uniref:DNA polymerase III subunit epsilon n=1 Tax=hydrothermal vent metagenome TaxID=652676 RepID=A0A3B1BM20_9ZZZZ